MIRIKNLELRIKLFTVVFISMLYSLFLPLASPVFASSHCQAGPGPHSPAGAGNGGLTGQSCSNIRNKDGSNVGPGNYSDVYVCIGACKYWVTYCTPDGCEERYAQPDCTQAPPQCNTPSAATSAIGNVFGKIVPPGPIFGLGFGATGISAFLTNLVALIYSLAIVVLIFMVLWGAWDWMTSEGDKEKLESAKRKLINAFIGIILFAIAFAAIKILGIFTGFKFFVGQ